MADDEELLGIAAHARINAVMPWFLFTSLRYLGMRYHDAATQQFLQQPWAGGTGAENYQRFRALCLQHVAELSDLLSTRQVQTNNLLRCPVLFPALCVVGRMFPQRACALVDLGTSAGLHLLLDLYSYAYPELGGRVFASRFEADVDLEIEFSWRGDRVRDPGRFFQAPIINQRIGIDLAPIDLAIPTQRQWADSFTPIDDSVLEGFLYLRKQVKSRLETGDVGNRLEPLAREIPHDQLLVIMHSFLSVQFTPEKTAELDRTFDKLGAQRDLAVISLENDLTSTSPVELWLRTYRRAQRHDQRLARCQDPLDVGSFLEWHGPQE